MHSGTNEAGVATGEVPSRRDHGATFVELLISIVLIGITGVAVLTALTVSISGSDQHRSKVAALAELEGAAAYLNRVAENDQRADCGAPTYTPTIFQQWLDEAKDGDLPTDPLVNPNPGVSVSVVGSPDCSSGIALVRLRAVHDRNNASEELSVTVGGITVLEDGPMSPLPPAGSCFWNGVNIDEPNPARKPSGFLDRTVTVSLNYIGDCTTETVSMDVPTYGTTGLALNLNGNATSGAFNYTFAKNFYSPWDVGNVSLLITTSDGFTFNSNFDVQP